MNAPVPVTLDQIVSRARRVMGEGKYVLGAGGRVPSSATPCDERGGCDCSGLVAWCLGLDRYQPKFDGQYIETTAIVNDATGLQKLFEKVSEWRPGYVVLYGDHNGHQGHVGIISEMTPAARVIHCSLGNYRLKGVAIAETGPEIFLARQAIAVRFKGVVPDVPAAA